MAAVAMFQGDYKKSLAIHYRVIGLDEKQELTYGAAVTVMSPGNLLICLNKYDEAIKIYDKTLTLLNKLKQIYSEFITKLIARNFSPS